MPARDFQRHFNQHIRLCKRARYWAEKSIEYMKAGQYAKAKDASKRCETWLARAMEIERKYRLRNPHA